MKIFLFFILFASIAFAGISQIISPVAATSQATVCTMEYAPVCGSVQVQCIMAPCNPVRETFSNSCMARSANATNVTSGACEDTTPPVIVGGDKDIHGCIGSAGYAWSVGENKCIRLWESGGKMSPRVALQDGSWIIESMNGKSIKSSGSLTFAKNTFTAKLCNTLNGQYGTHAGALILRKVIATRMYCDSDIMQVENAWNFSRAQFMVGATNLTVTTKK